MIEIHIINFGSILIQQLYSSLVETSREEGGELAIRMNFILDEFANFTKIDAFQSMLTVSRGRNIRFIICLQSFAQIEEKYGKEGAQNILDNTAWLYLKTGNIDTATKISDRLGSYTTQAYGESSNSNIKYDNSSSSMSLIQRKLLTPDEVQRIENPYLLVMIAGKPPALLNVPDISKMYFNKINGMGNEQQNQELRIKRENARKTKEVTPIKIWNIWDQYKSKEKKINIDEIIHDFRVMHKRGEKEIENKEDDE